MSNKMTCPACDAYLSSIRMAFENGEPCPNCGLSAVAAMEVIAARERGADEALIESTAKANQRADKAKAEVRKLRRKLDRIKSVIDEDGSDDGYF